MKLLCAALMALCLLGGAAGAGWVEYPLNWPAGIVSAPMITVNAGGYGYAYTRRTYADYPGELLSLQNGVWSFMDPPPKAMGRISIGNDNTLYSTDNAGSGYVWRFIPPANWNTVGKPATFGFTEFVNLVLFFIFIGVN